MAYDTRFHCISTQLEEECKLNSWFKSTWSINEICLLFWISIVWILSYKINLPKISIKMHLNSGYCHFLFCFECHSKHSNILPTLFCISANHANLRIGFEAMGKKYMVRADIQLKMKLCMWCVSVCQHLASHIGDSKNWQSQAYEWAFCLLLCKGYKEPNLHACQ